MIKAILFDFDHVLSLEPEANKEQEKWYSEYLKAEMYRKENLINMDKSFKKFKFSKDKIEKCLKARTELRVPNKDAFDLIEKAAIYGIQSYIGTNAPPIALEKWFKTYPKLKKHFSGIYYPETFDHTRKPQPEFFIQSLKQIKIWPHQVAFYDDKIQNVMGASQAGLRGFHYRGGPFRTSYSKS
jgi:HAD superfamily hydrolase (TIGR01509 family)